MHESVNNEIISLSSHVRYRAVDDEGVLIHLESGRAIVVNEVGLYILGLIDKQLPKEVMIASVVAEFDVSARQAEADLDLYLAELNGEQILGKSV